MFGPKPLDDEYVRKHARPGEDWQPARDRLEDEVARRYCELPACAVCAAASSSMESAAELHDFGMCRAQLEEWPASALSPRLFDAAHAQSAVHVQAQAAMARTQIREWLINVGRQTHPVNALMCATALDGYLVACRNFNLFEYAEWQGFFAQVYAVRELARTAFIEQYQSGDPHALPWRDAQTPTSGKEPPPCQ